MGHTKIFSQRILFIQVMETPICIVLIKIKENFFGRPILTPQIIQSTYAQRAAADGWVRLYFYLCTVWKPYVDKWIQKNKQWRPKSIRKYSYFMKSEWFVDSIIRSQFHCYSGKSFFLTLIYYIFRVLPCLKFIRFNDETLLQTSLFLSSPYLFSQLQPKSVDGRGGWQRGDCYQWPCSHR